MAFKVNIPADGACIFTGKTAIYKPTSQELALWRQALLPVHKKMEDRIGKDLLASVYKALGKAPER